MEPTPCKVLIADDHEVVRRGIRALIDEQAGWEVCGEASNGREAVEMATTLAPDVAVLDITMPELNGLDAARRIRKHAPDTEILILTVHQSEEVIHEVLEAGAKGYLLKSDAGRELVRAIALLLEHKPYLSSIAETMVLEGYLRTGNATPAPKLTGREREIVQLLAEGKSNKEVASALHISVRTAETHRTNVMRKLELHSVSELVRYAIRNRMVQA